MFTMKSFLCVILMIMIVTIVFSYIFGKNTKRHTGIYALAALVLFSTFGSAFALTVAEAPKDLSDPAMKNYVIYTDSDHTHTSSVQESVAENESEASPAASEDGEGDVLGVFDEFTPEDFESPSKSFFDTFFDGLISGFDRLLDSDDPSGLVSFGNDYMDKADSMNIEDIPILRDFTHGMNRFFNHMFSKIERKMLSLFDV